MKAVRGCPVFVLRKVQAFCRRRVMNLPEATAVPARRKRGEAAFPAITPEAQELIFIFSDVKLFL
jgi:hypothetical protein